jgi:putative ABC transport system ATP-binding protein
MSWFDVRDDADQPARAPRGVESVDPVGVARSTDPARVARSADPARVARSADPVGRARPAGSVPPTARGNGGRHERTPRPSGADRPGLGVTCRNVVYIYRLEGYDVVALAGVDLDIAAGESVALLGPSGAGKSTLLSLLAGLLRPSAGRLTVGGHDLVRADDAELQVMRSTAVGVVLQGASRNLLPYLSAEQNVRFAQRGAPADRRGQLPAARDVLGLVGLTNRGRHRLAPQRLSPGERQRLALAVALATGPGLLLADEPTSQLDSRARDEVLAALDAANGAGTTIVLVTHDPDVGARMGRTVTIRDGRVGAEGRRGEDYAIVGRDGTVHLPADVLKAVPPGTLLGVEAQPDGTVLLIPAGESLGEERDAHRP